MQIQNQITVQRLTAEGRPISIKKKNLLCLFDVDDPHSGDADGELPSNALHASEKRASPSANEYEESNS